MSSSIQNPISTLPTTLSQTQSQKLDLAITLALHSWPALSLAVTSGWGGPASVSNDKRDWFCGAISDLFTERPETDVYDLEDVLIQVMNDEFDVVVDDGSAGDVAEKIMDLKAQVEKGEFGEIDTLHEAYRLKVERKRPGGSSGVEGFTKVEVDDKEAETDGDSDEEEAAEHEIDEVDIDIDMDDSPATLTGVTREKVAPEIDEDGFTKVASRKKR
jgi:pre-rRNA-processing protein TSR2